MCDDDTQVRHRFAGRSHGEPGERPGWPRVPGGNRPGDRPGLTFTHPRAWRGGRTLDPVHLYDGTLPSQDAPELAWLAFEQSGVLTFRQAAAQLGRSRVRTLVANGRWRAVCRGLLVCHSGPLTRNQQLWVAVLMAGAGALLAGVASLEKAGVRRLPTDPVHVLVPANRARSVHAGRLLPGMPAVAIRFTASLAEDERHRMGRPPRTSADRAVVDAVAWAPDDDQARRIIAATCQQRRLLPEEIREAALRRPRTRRRRLLLETVADVAGGAEALSELDFVRLCRRYRLPPPDLQQRRRDATGRVRYLDAYWRQWRLHVEVDGAHHMDVQHWEADMLRQNQIWIKGDRVLRFPGWLPRRDPGKVADQVRSALAAAGWPG